MCCDDGEGVEGWQEEEEEEEEEKTRLEVVARNEKVGIFFFSWSGIKDVRSRYWTIQPLGSVR